MSIAVACKLLTCVYVILNPVWTCRLDKQDAVATTIAGEAQGGDGTGTGAAWDKTFGLWPTQDQNPLTLRFSTPGTPLEDADDQLKELFPHATTIRIVKLKHVKGRRKTIIEVVKS